MFQSYLKPDLEIEVYKNYQISENQIATVKLVELYREGERFILDEYSPDNKTTVWGTQFWRCIVLKSDYYQEGMTKILPFKYIYSIGNISPANPYVEKNNNIPENIINDEFISVDGIQAF